MGNTYFRLKQFNINQDKCGMKVTTEACLFGAVVANELQHENGANALDIGTGTGLLTLMVAQQNASISIDAVEIDKDAAIQAADNFLASPWQDRLQVHQTKIQDYITAKKYDIIFTNPPFFANNLQGTKQQKNKALHNDELPFDELASQVKRHLKSSGELYVLLPCYEFVLLAEKLAAIGLYVTKQWNIRQSLDHNYFRNIGCFSNKKTPLAQVEIAIKDADNNYTQAFVHLLKPYYLAL